MKNLLTGGVGFAASEIVQQYNQYNVNDVAAAITQLVIAIITIIGFFNNKKNTTK